MIMKNSIDNSRIWLPAAGVALIAIASWSLTYAGSAQGQSRGAKANPSASAAGGVAPGIRLIIRDGWQVQTSTGQPDGAAISKAGFAATGWSPTVVPATVSGVLAHAGAYPDPFFSTNLRDWPGMGRGGRGANGPGAPGAAATPAGNPFS